MALIILVSASDSGLLVALHSAQSARTACNPIVQLLFVKVANYNLLGFSLSQAGVVL